MKVRVRYAPSPTGLQHIGSIRTALFDYFYAKSQKGRFILRIEDTDRERFDSESLNDIYQTFSWLGIRWDEGPDIGGPCGPYFQSERLDQYRIHAEELISKGEAYYCFCTSARLEQLRKKQAENKEAQGYDRRCRNLSSDQIAEMKKENPNPVVRFKLPLEGATGFDDAILGYIERKNEDISPDPVLLKSDGFPTYNFANVIDDHYMQISHVFRAQEYVPSAPLYILLYQAFSWDVPVFCHLPMVLGDDGHKLSKRHGATSIREFREAGYLPEALINYVTLLGWSLDDKTELFSKQELEKVFSLERINKAPATFDYKKLEWFNGVYIREKSESELIGLILPFMKTAGLISEKPAENEMKKLQEAVPLIQPRLKYLSEAPEKLEFLFKEITIQKASDLIPKKLDKEKTVAVLESLLNIIEGFEQRSDEENENLFRKYAEKLEVKLGLLLMPLRIALTGTPVSPPLLESIRILGEEKAEQRVRKALEMLENEI